MTDTAPDLTITAHPTLSATVETERSWRLSAEATEAWMALTFALERHPNVVPCEQSGELWFGDTTQRLLAADLCGLCPVRAACGTYADAARESDGVWAGRDRDYDSRRRAARWRRLHASHDDANIPDHPDAEDFDEQQP